MAVKPEKESNNVFLFVYVLSANLCHAEDVKDDYKIPKGTIYHKGHFLENFNFDKRSRIYEMKKSKVIYFSKECPDVNFHTKGDKLILNNRDYMDIVVYIERKDLNHI